MTELNIYTDGASRGNPGPAGIGAVIFDKTGNRKEELAKYIGETTNNVAEYKAILEGLKLAKSLTPKVVNLFADSQLVIKQLTGEYRVKSKRLKPYYNEVKALLAEIPEYNLKHIPREENKEADKLANLGIDQLDKQNEELKFDLNELSNQLKEEVTEFEVSPDLIPIINEIKSQIINRDLNMDDSLTQGIIYGLLLAKRIN
ncbi:ribonuclease HI family protein [Selenihalanaerobacter shriftii]|uniref:Ribonuclease HI n=1 Tax=Selenihalanaerobacter shriftii TaxID=142842 RepID=A0A1T4MYE4_9FIRM|nr:ribonuclease HI family protein [Selenihalanaerobacter shriftii]SJZ71864.1 ribonuclease HI [Selenihalanaerobacter shriftii]